MEDTEERNDRERDGERRKLKFCSDQEEEEGGKGKE